MMSRWERDNGMEANWGQHQKWQERRIVGRRKSGHQEAGMGEWRAIAEHAWGTTRDRPFVERGAHWNTLLEWHYEGGCVEGNTWDLEGVDDIRERGGVVRYCQKDGMGR